MTDADRQYWHGPLAPMVRDPHPSDGLWRANWPEIVLVAILSAAVLFMAGVAMLVVAG